MKILITILTIAFITLNLNAQQWTQTSGPKKSGIYLPTNTLQKVSNDTFLAGTDGGGIYKTTNSGYDWVNVLNITDMIWTIAKSSNGTLYAGTNQRGIYRSTNNGDSWTQVFDPGSLIFDINFDVDGNIFAACEIDGIYKSTDNGNNWELFWQTDLIPTSIYVDGNEFYIGTIADGLYYSDDGVNFNNLAFSGDVVWEIIANQSGLYVCNELSGLNVSNDGLNFSNYAFPNSLVTNYFISSSGIEYLLVDLTDVYKYSTLENQWISFTDGLGSSGVTDIDEDSQGFLLGSTSNDGVFKTTVSTFPPDILTLSSVNSEYCAGNFFSMNYTVEGGFEPNNNFQVQISDKNGSFASPITVGSVQSQVSGSIDVVIPFDTPQGTDYKLRIVSTHPYIVGPVTSSFVVNELNTTLTTPLDNASNVALKPTFTWVANDCALSYTLQISKDQNFINIDHLISDLSSNSYSMQVSLDKNTTYYWRVVLLSNLGDELYTDAFSFTTLNTVTQTIELKSGWNLISSYITIDNMDIETYLASIKSQMLIVKDPTGKVYIPSYEIDQIGNWINGTAYQIYMTSAQTLELTGDAIVPENYVINLKSGWNKIGYLRNSNRSVVTCFADLTDNDNLLIAKSFDGKVYIPSYGINTIVNLVPGNGYLLYMFNADSFSYPAN